MDGMLAGKGSVGDNFDLAKMSEEGDIKELKKSGLSEQGPPKRGVDEAIDPSRQTAKIMTLKGRHQPRNVARANHRQNYATAMPSGCVI